MRRAVSLLIALSAALPLAAAENHTVEMKEWPVPWADSHPSHPCPVSPDHVWFIGDSGNYLAALNPQTGAFKRIDLIDEPAPHALAAASSGVLWFTGTARSYIARFDPQTRIISRTPMPYAVAADPYALIMELGERNLWFTLQSSNMIGRLRIESGTVDLIAVPTPKALPDGITSAPNGAPWIALSGANKVASVDPRTFVITEHTLPRAAARPRRLGFTSDGRLWYVDFAEGYLGMFTPRPSAGAGIVAGVIAGADANKGSGPGSSPGAAQSTGTGAMNKTTGTGAMKEWRFPAGKDSQPYGMAVDSQDRIWAVETGTQPNRLVGFDPKTERFFSSTPVPSGGGSIRDLRYDRASSGVWFGTDTNTIGYAKVH